MLRVYPVQAVGVLKLCCTASSFEEHVGTAAPRRREALQFCVDGTCRCDDPRRAGALACPDEGSGPMRAVRRKTLATKLAPTADGGCSHVVYSIAGWAMWTMLLRTA